MKQLVLAVVIAFLLSVQSVMAQDFCNGDHDFDGDCDATDVASFLVDFGRSQYNNPCPPDGPTPVPKTGQTTSYATGDDGDLERGVALVTPRFTDNLDGTVTDNQTGLIWLKNANCFSIRTWQNALSDCNGLADGQCGLTDGSSSGDWRLPNYKELFSLVDAENHNPALPSGHPFNGVQSLNYWSSSTHAFIDFISWHVDMSIGIVDIDSKTSNRYVWPVRGGR